MTFHPPHDSASFAGLRPTLLASMILTDFRDESRSGLVLPRNLDGSRGLNRATGHAANKAQNDLEALAGWLLHFSSSSTMESYRKKAQRLLLWSILNRTKPLSSLTSEDLTHYRSFLVDPQPRDLWISKHGRRAGRGQEDWRPFAGPLSPASARQSIAVLNRMFSWLVESGYLASNPLLDSSQSASHPSTLSWTLVRGSLPDIIDEAIDSLPCFTRREKEHVERVRWLFSLLCFGGFSIAEVADNSMGVFHVRRNGESAKWWIDLSDGVRRYERLVPLKLMSALIRYRLFHNLSAFPDDGEVTPLVLPIGGRKRSLGPRALYVIAKTILLSASQFVSEKTTDEEDSHEAFWIAGGRPGSFSRRLAAKDVDRSVPK